jgi:hypothetical protein
MALMQVREFLEFIQICGKVVGKKIGHTFWPYFRWSAITAS